MQDAIRRRKLAFRAGRRGIREMDLLMIAFVDAHMAAFDEADLDQFESLLDIPDQDVYAWIMGRAAPPPERQSRVLDLLLSFRYAAVARDGTDPAL